MLFHEIYGCYYNAVAEILRQAVNGKLTEKEIQKIVTEKAFSENPYTEDEISRYFEENKEEYTIAYRKAKHILFLI